MNKERWAGREVKAEALMEYKFSDFSQQRWCRGISLWGEHPTTTLQEWCSDRLCFSLQLSKCRLLPDLSEKILTDREAQS